MANLLKQGFQELSEQARVLEASKHHEQLYGGRNQLNIDANSLLKWKVRAKNLIAKACGENSQHFLLFQESESSPYSSSLQNFLRMRAVFDGAREDFEAGYLASVHDLVRAEVFDSELEQASELLQSGYEIAAAVIAGVVLETAIRALCTKNQITPSKLDRMNGDLAKAGIYNSVVQKRITHLAAVRNSAAHGNETEFKTHDVRAMITEIEQLLANHLS
jgi:hypothetical protein